MPVASPGITVKFTPATSVPTLFSPFSVAATGLVLASLLPIVIFLLRNTNVPALTIVPARAKLVAVTVALVLITNAVDVNPAPVTAHVPFNAVIPDDAIVIWSPVLIPALRGVSVKTIPVVAVIVPVNGALKYTVVALTPDT